MLTLLFACSLFASPECPQPDGTRYYFILFGGQSQPFQPRSGHTWATYVKVAPTATGTLQVEAHTISWLPADGQVEPFRLRRVPGRNYPLEETFALYPPGDGRMSRWGPYEIDAERYCLALEQIQRLESGVVRYRVLDSLGRDQTVCHCVHAVTYADPVMKHRIQPVIQVGERGTSKLAARYMRAGAFPYGTTIHEWLIPVLGIDAYGVIPRQPGERIVRRFF